LGPGTNSETTEIIDRRKMKRISLIFAAIFLVLVSIFDQTNAQEKIAIGADSIWWQALQQASCDKALDPAILNLAVPGSTVKSLMKRLYVKLPQDISVIIIAIGINNFILLHQTPDQIAQEIWNLLIATRERAPLANIVLQSVLPTRVEGQLSKDIVELNQKLVQMANILDIDYWDIHGEFAEEDGLTGRADLVRDRNVHLTKEGKRLLYGLLDFCLQGSLL